MCMNGFEIFGYFQSNLCSFLCLVSLFSVVEFHLAPGLFLKWNLQLSTEVTNLRLKSGLECIIVNVAPGPGAQRFISLKKFKVL